MDATTISNSQSDIQETDISVIVPMYNEEESIGLFFERIEPILESLTERYEVICIDDGSNDSTMALLIAHRCRSEKIKVLSLSRNFGKDVALSAGLSHASGNAIVPMDCDLQDPPELIAEMYQLLLQGFDVVTAQRSERGSDSHLKRLTARWFYRIHNSIAEVTIPDDTGDFRMFNRKVLDVLNCIPEKTRFMKGLFAWVGFKQTSVQYSRCERAAGKTKWHYWKLWNFALDGLIGGSTLPLRIWTYFGGLIAVFALSYASYVLMKTLLFGADIPGYASLLIAVLFLGSFNIIATGILGEYLARIHTEVRNRPLYIVREAHGISTNQEKDSWNGTSMVDSMLCKTNTGGFAQGGK